MIGPWGIGGVVLFLAARAGPPGDANAKVEDARLVAAVRVAAEKGLAPDKVEGAVGRKATLNTFRKEDEGPFRRADLAPDPKAKPSLPDRETLRWAAYWVRPVEARNPRVVGIAWPKKGRPQVFFGEVLPPR